MNVRPRHARRRLAPSLFEPGLAEAPPAGQMARQHAHFPSAHLVGAVEQELQAHLLARSPEAAQEPLQPL